MDCEVLRPKSSFIKRRKRERRIYEESEIYEKEN
jgi:hypothetical protein